MQIVALLLRHPVQRIWLSQKSSTGRFYSFFVFHSVLYGWKAPLLEDNFPIEGCRRGYNPVKVNAGRKDKIVYLHFPDDGGEFAVVNALSIYVIESQRF